MITIDKWCTQTIKQRNDPKQSLPIAMEKVISLKALVNECLANYTELWHE